MRGAWWVNSPYHSSGLCPSVARIPSLTIRARSHSALPNRSRHSGECPHIMSTRISRVDAAPLLCMIDSSIFLVLRETLTLVYAFFMLLPN